MSLLPPHGTHQRVRLLRFFTGLNQFEMAVRLGTSQSWLSKLESGQGDLTVKQLQAIRQEFGISGDAFMDGLISYQDISERFSYSPSLPKKYLHPATSKVRIFYGFIALFEKEWGEAKTRQWIQSLKIKPEIFANPELKVSIQLLFDFIAKGFQEKTLTSRTAWRLVAEKTLSKTAIGFAHEDLSKSTTPEEAIHSFLKVIRLFTCDCILEVFERKKSSLGIVVAESTKMRELFEPNPSMARALISFQQSLFEELGRLGGSWNFKVTLGKLPHVIHQPRKDQMQWSRMYHVEWS